MSAIQIDASRCCGDAFCVRVCPANCLRMKGDKAAPVPLSENLCLSCGQCLAVCPRSAVSLDGVSSSADDAPIAAPSPEDASRLIRTRRSVRDFKNTPVPRVALEQALDVARYAPTGKNRQDISWVAIDDKSKLDALTALIIDSMRGMDGTQRLVSAFEKGRDPIFHGAPCAIFAHAADAYDLSPSDCALAVGYLDLMLHSMGLGACWAGFAIRISQLFPVVRDFLGVPEDRKVYAGLMLGYPAVRYRHIPPRKPAKLSWL